MIFPHEARLRNITYQTTAYVEVKVIEKVVQADGTMRIEGEEEVGKVEIGSIPVMVRSTFCSLNNEDNMRSEDKECDYDQGGYFIINGGEKVIVA